MSALEQALADYLQLRRSLGHELAQVGWLLPGFVAHLDAHGLPTVTVEAALAWAQHAPRSPAGGMTSVGPYNFRLLLADQPLPPLPLGNRPGASTGRRR